MSFLILIDWFFSEVEPRRMGSEGSSWGLLLMMGRALSKLFSFSVQNFCLLSKGENYQNKVNMQEIKPQHVLST